MHEAGLARGVAHTLGERGLRLAEVRLDVRGGHHEPAEFEAALRAHLAEALPAQDTAAAAVEIRRLPFGHLCLTCGLEFEAPGVAEPCPTCGAESLPAIFEEQVEVASRLAG